MSARQVLVPLDMTNLEIRRFVFHLLAAAPGSPVEGVPFWNTATHTLEIWNGSSWDIFGTLDQISAPAADVAMATHKITGLGDPTNPQDAATRAWTLALKVSDLTALSADWSVNSHKITSVSDPTNPQDAATMAWTQAQIAGVRDVKESVRVATLVALPAYTRVGNVLTANANGAFAAIDGVTLATADTSPPRFLLNLGAQAGADKGLYLLTTTGTGGTPWVATRTTDANTDALVTEGLYVWAVENAQPTGWLLTTADPITLNTTALTFTQISALGQITAGAGLTKTGATVDVVAGATPGSGGPGGGVVVNADDIVIDTTVVARKYSVDVGDNASTSIVLTHNLNTLDVLVQVYVKGAAGALVDCDVQHTSVNTVTLVFAVAPTAAQYRATVLG